MEGIFWLFIYVSAAVAPLAQIATDQHPNLVDRNFLTPATLLALISCISYDASALLARRSPIRREESTCGEAPGVVSNRRLLQLAPVALLAAGYYIISKGGPTPFFTSRSALGQNFAGTEQSTSQVGSAFTETFGTVPLLIAWTGITCVLSRDSSKRTPKMAIMWILLAAANLVVNNPISNARYWFLTVAISFAFSRPRFTGRRYRGALIAGVAAALLIFPYSDYFRYTTHSASASESGSVLDTLSNKDYDQTIMTANGMWWVDAHGHTMGDQLLGDLLFWVPRSAWPSKPLDTGVMIGRDLGGPNANLSSPLWLEFWIDFGGLGMIAGLFGLGLVSRRLDDLFLRSQNPSRIYPLVIEIGLPLLAGYQLILLRGPILQSMSRLAVALAVLLYISERNVTARIGDARDRIRSILSAS